jgi:hypothetical protein
VLIEQGYLPSAAMNLDPNDDSFEAELVRFLTDKPLWAAIVLVATIAAYFLSTAPQ